MALPPTSRKERITNRARALAALLLPLAALAVVALVASKLLHAGPVTDTSRVLEKAGMEEGQWLSATSSGVTVTKDVEAVPDTIGVTGVGATTVTFYTITGTY